MIPRLPPGQYPSSHRSPRRSSLSEYPSRSLLVLSHSTTRALSSSSSRVVLVAAGHRRAAASLRASDGVRRGEMLGDEPNGGSRRWRTKKKACLCGKPLLLRRSDDLLDLHTGILHDLRPLDDLDWRSGRTGRRSGDDGDAALVEGLDDGGHRQHLVDRLVQAPRRSGPACRANRPRRPATPPPTARRRSRSGSARRARLRRIAAATVGQAFFSLLAALHHRAASRPWWVSKEFAGDEIGRGRPGAPCRARNRSVPDFS